MDAASDISNTTVIVPQFGQSELTVRCVHSLLEHHPALKHVLIIDDGSDLSELNAIKAQSFHNTEIIWHPTNLGVTAAWNSAARLSGSEFLIFLNNDTQTSGPWCNQLVGVFEDERIRFAGPETRRPDEIPKDLREHFGFKSLLSGWCFAIRRKDLLSLNGFDSRLRLYFSDTDLQCRIAEQFGKNSFQAISGLPLRHALHQTTKTLVKPRDQWQRDYERFLQKWSRRIQDVSK